MNIQITNIPNGQKIKSIDFKIIFDESGEVSTDDYSIDKIEMSRSSKESADRISNNTNTTNAQISANDSDVVKPPEIDISKREAKIPDEMLEESFWCRFVYL